MTPTHSICYMFSNLYPMAQTTNIQPFNFITEEIPIHSSSLVPRTRTTLLPTLPVSTHKKPAHTAGDSQTSLSTLCEHQTNQLTCSKNMHALLSTYHLILHMKVSHIKSNHTGHQRKQVQNLVATCYHCACKLYIGLPPKASLLHNTQKPANLPPYFSQHTQDCLPITPKFIHLQVPLFLNTCGFTRHLHPHGINISLNLPQHTKHACRFCQLPPVHQNCSLPSNSYKL